MSILSTSDFVGIHQITTSGNETTELEAVIAYSEKKFLRDLLGDDLYAAFIAGLAITPTIPKKWTDLRDGCTYKIYDEDDEKDLNYFNVIHRGVKEMLKYFTCYVWNNQQRFQQNTIGISIPSIENKEIVSMEGFMSYQQTIINDAIEIYNEVIKFVEFMNYGYPISSFDSGTATTITTKYLANGDTIKIDGVEYVVSNVTDTTFDTSATRGAMWDKAFYPNIFSKELKKQFVGL